MHATMSANVAASSSSNVLPPRHYHQHSASMSTSQYDQQQQQIMATLSNGHGPIGPPMHVSPFYGPNFPQQIPIASQQQMPTAPASSFDPRNLEIKTCSVEQTLLPLVQQISTLVNFKESIITGGRPKSERALRAALKIGTAVEAAVERFVAVGETIADENPDIQPELYDACHEARIAGSSIANLHNSMLVDPLLQQQQDIMMATENGAGAGIPTVDTAQLVRAARQLLSSVTRVLLLADRVLVRHILRAEDKIAYSLAKLEHTSNFSEFVQIFTEFGGQMVDLAHRSGDRQQDLKSEKRRAQMQVARAQLERLTMLLLISSKTLLRHPDDPAARQCRDGVFHQIRTALQLIAVCVTDGVMPFDAAAAYPSPLDEISRITDGPLDIGIQLTASVAIRQLCEMLDMCRMMSLIGSGVRERLVAALDALCEMSADFTDCAWTSHHQREQILDLLEECRFEMSNLVNSPPPSDVGSGGSGGGTNLHHQQQNQHNDDRLRTESIEVTVERLNRRLKDLRKQLQVVALEQIATVFRQNEDQTILSSLKTCSIAGDIDGVERFLEQFRMHAEHLQEVCRLLHHISLTDALHVFTGHAERNMRALAPLTLLAGRVLCVHPSSRIARENLEVFCDTWATNVNDLARLTKELDAACSGRLAAEKQAYMSLPRPGVSSTSVNSVFCFQHEASPLCAPITTNSSSPSVLSSPRSASTNIAPIPNVVCCCDGGCGAVCCVSGKSSGANGDCRHCQQQRQQQFVVPPTALTVLPSVLCQQQPKFMLSSSSSHHQHQSPTLSLSNHPQHSAFQLMNAANPVYSTSYYATIATAVGDGGGGTGTQQQAAMVSTTVSAFHAFGFADQTVLQNAETPTTPSPRPAPRTARSSSTPSARGLASASSSLIMAPPPPAPAPTPEVGRRQASAAAKPAADVDKELRHAMAQMKKSLAKQQELQQQKGKEEIANEHGDDGKANMKKTTNVMSISAIFRGIRREPKEKKSIEKKKKMGKSWAIFERENHSDGEAQQMARQKEKMKNKNANVNGEGKAGGLNLMAEAKKNDDDDDDGDDGQQDWRTFCQSSRLLRVDLLAASARKNAKNNNFANGTNFENSMRLKKFLADANGIGRGLKEEEGREEEENGEGNGHHSPLYAQIQKPRNVVGQNKCQQQQQRNKEEETTTKKKQRCCQNGNGQQQIEQNQQDDFRPHQFSPRLEQQQSGGSLKSAFTPYEQFNSLQRQKQQQQQFPSSYPKSPPRQRRVADDEYDEEEAQDDDSWGEQQQQMMTVKFNRIGNGPDEPVIMRQQQQKQRHLAQAREDSVPSIQDSIQSSSGYGSGVGGTKSSKSSSRKSSQEHQQQQQEEQKCSVTMEIVADQNNRNDYLEGNREEDIDGNAQSNGAIASSHYATVFVGRAPLAKCDEIEEGEEGEEELEEYNDDEEAEEEEIVWTEREEGQIQDAIDSGPNEEMRRQHHRNKEGSQATTKAGGNGLGMMNIVDGNSVARNMKEEEEDFVVRMRAKKSARLAAATQPQQQQQNSSRFEQRISQILESLQAEAESLIRLEEHQRQPIATRRSGSSGGGRLWAPMAPILLKEGSGGGTAKGNGAGSG